MYITGRSAKKDNYTLSLSQFTLNLYYCIIDQIQSIRLLITESQTNDTAKKLGAINLVLIDKKTNYINLRVETPPIYKNQKIIIMNIKTLSAVSFSILSLISSTSFANSSDSFSATISFKAPVICKADLLNVSSTDTETKVTIKELCNVGGGHDLVLIHSNVEEETEASYHNQATTIGTTGRTIIASRDGAYHGKRQLTIPHVNGKPVQIIGAFMSRGNYARL